MAKVVKRSGKLYLDYRHCGERIRKSTGLDDTPENIEKLEKDVIPALMMKIKMGDFVKPDKKKFSHYFSKFLVDHQNDKGYHNRIYFYNKVNERFGNVDIVSINRMAIKDYLASFDVKNATKREYLKCIKGVLDIALDDEVIEKNVAANITFKREDKEEVLVFDNSEIELLLDNADEMFRNFLGISLYSGMRSGEVLGLMHSDIHDDKISVQRSISRGRVTTPKTLGSIRDVPMFERIRPFVESQMRLSESLYLFDYNKHFIKDVSFFRTRWHNLVTACQIDYRKVYCTRHTFITAMLNSGKYKIMEIAAIVGHSSPQMIMTKYSGFIKNEHLKIDTNVDIFGSENGHSLDTVRKLKEL